MLKDLGPGVMGLHSAMKTGAQAMKEMEVLQKIAFVSTNRQLISMSGRTRVVLTPITSFVKFCLPKPGNK